MTYFTIAVLILFVTDILARIALHERRDLAPKKPLKDLLGVIAIDLVFIIWAAYLLGEN